MHVCVHCVVVSCGLVPAGMQSPLQLGRAEAASERGVEARAQRVSASRFVSSITLDLLSYSYIHTMGTVHGTRMVLSTQLYLSPLPYMHACCIDSITECTPYHSGVGHIPRHHTHTRLGLGLDFSTKKSKHAGPHISLGTH